MDRKLTRLFGDSRASPQGHESGRRGPLGSKARWASAIYSIPNLQEHSGCVRFHRSCSRLVTLTR